MLTPQEASYWRDIFRKILKIGYEFELNLPENKGTCKGDHIICPCSHPKKDETKCWSKCLIFDTCKLKETAGKCPGIHCIEFVSPCQTCLDAVRDCSRCELYDNPKTKPSKVREELGHILQPSKNLATVGSNGVFEITTDGSLSGDRGVEVTTVGRRVNYDVFYTQSFRILKEAVSRGAYINERTSIHMHLVAGYFTLSADGEVKYKKGGYRSSRCINELEKEAPDIILMNFHQLVRRYQNALTWISSSGESLDRLTRWSKFRKPILKFSPIRSNSMYKILEELSAHDGHNGRYAFINYSNCTWVDNYLTRLHLEARFCDGMLSPSAVSAMGILFYSLMLKAVWLSQYGVLKAGDEEYMKQAYTIQKSLLNNDGDYGGPRHSNTADFEPYRETVRSQAAEMLGLLQSELKKHGPSVKVLQKLADMPCSLRLIRGDSWDKIESDLSEKVDTSLPHMEEVLSTIDTLRVDDCADKNEWFGAVAEDLSIETSDVEKIVGSLLSSQKIVWEPAVGTFLRC